MTGGETGKAKPEIYDAWIERRRRTVDTLKWEEAETLVSEDHHDALYLFFFFQSLCVLAKVLVAAVVIYSPSLRRFSRRARRQGQ